MFFFRETTKVREYGVLKQYSQTGQGMKHLPAADMKHAQEGMKHGFQLNFYKKKTIAIATVFGFVSGGGRWIRTIESCASRFTVCPLWPLGNPTKV